MATEYYFAISEPVIDPVGPAVRLTRSLIRGFGRFGR